MKESKKRETPKLTGQKQLTCINECRITDPKTNRVELYEDGFGYIYTVSEAKAKVLLATGNFLEVN